MKEAEQEEAEQEMVACGYYANALSGMAFYSRGG
jgi:hypothetical protein